MVYRVDPGTSAQRQGLREGDRILAVNNNVVVHEDYAVVRLGWYSSWYKRRFYISSGRKSSPTIAWALWCVGQASPPDPVIWS